MVAPPKKTMIASDSHKHRIDFVSARQQVADLHDGGDDGDGGGEQDRRLRQPDLTAGYEAGQVLLDQMPCGFGIAFAPFEYGEKQDNREQIEQELHE